MSAPCGSWPSPLAAARLAEGSVRLGDVACDGDDVYWTEGRPAEGGRSVLVAARGGAPPRDLLPAPFSVRTRAHEYGGGALAVHGGRVWFSNFADQRLYALEPGGEPHPLTPDDGRRWADAAVDAGRERLVSVCEDPRGEGEPRNTLVSLPFAGGEPEPLWEGADFVSSPCLSPDGARLAWLGWDHPDMPWDATSLWLAELDAEGRPREPRRVAGGPGVSVFQPGWSPDGVLHFVSDRSGWWNLHRLTESGVEALAPRRAECGLPQWVFGMSTWAFADPETLVAAWCEDGVWSLAALEPEAGWRTLGTPWTWVGSLRAAGGSLVLRAASGAEPEALVRLEPHGGRAEVLRRCGDLASFGLDASWVSLPEAVAFPTEGGETAHGLLYRPRHPDARVPDGERPPLLVTSHGGPTAATAPVFDPRVQFWTTRGFAVLDVNYRGSTGYGRAYRELLRGAWGVADVADCECGARALVERGEVDGARMAIRGGSAGGYTTLCALTFGDTFAAGASHYGISDLEALARDTHKFESRYLDGLVGPWPEARERYLARSPIHHAGRLACPVIFFQGLEDPVVPPDQAEAMVAALREKGLRVAYLAFEGEQHGFRRAESIVRALEAELFFYGAIFGFTPADAIEPVPIWNA